MTEPIKLNLGAGDTQIEGYIPVDRRSGQEIFPLAYGDSSVDQIRASHVLEHVSHRETLNVVRDWVRALKPGGIMQIAVPDFDALIEMYQQGAGQVEGYLFGAHIDANDIHLAMFNKEKLTEVMTLAGLVDIKPWNDSVVDCHAYPFSLNLQGTKPQPAEIPTEARTVNETFARLDALPDEKRQPFGNRDMASAPKIGAVMSVPRLGFMDNFFCAFESLLPYRIPLKKVTGAFWGQCLQRGIQMLIADGYDLILTLDYDSVFTKDAIPALVKLMREHPEADAIAPIECHRSAPTPLMTIEGADGKPMALVPRELFTDTDLLKIRTAHFGLTLLRTASLLKTPKPWFFGQPNDQGDWAENRVDDDIWFWFQWAKAGNSLYLANRVTIGHAELMIRWPDVNLAAQYQAPNDFWAKGKPEGVWK